MHLVKVDLRQPGIGLYVTPRDPEAVKQGWQYRLEHTLSAARRQNLAVATNAVFFHAQGVGRIGMTRLYRPGQLARAQQTVIADGQASHNYLRGHLVWFDEELMPHLLGPHRRLEEVRDRARWAVGGEFQVVTGGRPHPNLGRRPLGQIVPRTVLGWDRSNRLLYLAVFQRAGYDEVARALIEQGVPDAVLLDGGGSSCMVIGQQARNMRPGIVHGGLRPVAVHFGVRAEPLRE
jgi:exopolysaccharide biosynthesis protein